MFGVEARSLFKDIGQHITMATQDPRSHEYLVQGLRLLSREETQLRLWTLSGGDNINYFYLFIIIINVIFIYYIFIYYILL